MAQAGRKIGLGLTPSRRVVISGGSWTPPGPPAPPLVGPGASWTGAAASGFAGSVPDPSLPARSTAKPAVQWWTVNKQRINANIVIGVDADALGGVAYVDFKIEGTVQRATLSRYDDTDVNGKARSRVGYWVTVNHTAFIAKVGAGGTINAYAMATANDGTMQTRTIGPLVLFAKPVSATINVYNVTPSAGSNTVTATGGTYVSFIAAMTQLNVHAPESAHVVFTETASLQMGEATTYYGGHTGYIVLRAANGVTATLLRGTVFDKYNTAGTNGVKAWEWWPWQNAVEFRGSGVVLDMKNWFNVRCNTEDPHWFNGCVITNSIGTRDSLYWNLGPRKGLSVSSFGNVLGAYFTDGTSQYVDLESAASAPISGQLTGGMITGWSALDQTSGDHGACRFLANNYERGSDPRYFYNQINSISVTFDGTGGTGTVVTYLDGGGAPRLDCRINGFTVGGAFPLLLGSDDAQPYFTMQNVCDAITAIAGGHWSGGTALDNSRACWMLAQDGGQTITPTTTPATLFSYVGFHTEYVHYRNTTPVENAIIRNIILRKSFFTTNILSTQGFGAALDCICRDSVFESAAQDSMNGAWAGSHVVMTNVFYDAPFPVYDSTDNYSLISQCIFPSVGIGAGEPGWPTHTVISNCITAGGWPTGGAAANLAPLADYAAMVALFGDKANGNFAPAGGGFLTSNLKPKITDYDGLTRARAANDAVGPWAVGAVAPTYAF